MVGDTCTGRFKAKFFRKLGFNETNVSEFGRALRTIAKSEEIIESVTTVYGTKYIIDGDIRTPRKKTVKIRTVLILEKGETSARFVTVYPV